jgi:plastocyanin
VLTLLPNKAKGKQADKAVRYRASGGRVAAAVSLMTIALSGCGLGGPAHGPPAANAAAVVEMGFESFSPTNVTIRTGDTVEWRNTSLITHTVTDDPKRAIVPSDAGLPPGAQPFDSGDIPAGQVYLRTFAVAGTYQYFCTEHEAEGMTGTIVVKPAS